MADERIQLLSDIEEIKSLRSRYFRLLDAKDWDAFEDLFTDDAELVYAVPDQQFVPPGAEMPGDGTAHVGREQLLSFLRSANQEITTLHLCHMPEISVVGPDEAIGFWRMTDYTECPTVGGAVWVRGYGRYEDQYRRISRGWRINRSVFYRYNMDPWPLG